jgi:gluconolactonase
MRPAPDGRLYAAQNGRKRIVAYTSAGAETVLAAGVGSNDLAVNARGEVYFTDPAARRIWFIDVQGDKGGVYEGISFPNGFRFSPDQSPRLVDDSHGRWVWWFQVQENGALANTETFYHLEASDETSATGRAWRACMSRPAIKFSAASAIKEFCRGCR